MDTVYGQALRRAGRENTSRTMVAWIFGEAGYRRASTLTGARCSRTIARPTSEDLCYSRNGFRLRSLMSIREIARRAKVSTATVSRTINRHSGVQPQLGRLAFQALLSDVRRVSPNPQRHRVRPENEFRAARFDRHEFPEALVLSAAYGIGVCDVKPGCQSFWPRIRLGGCPCS